MLTSCINFVTFIYRSLHSPDKTYFLIILRIGKYVCHITMARSWLGCLFGVLIPSAVFYLYLLLNGNIRVFILSLLNINTPCIIVVPSAEIGSFKIDGKSGSLSANLEKTGLHLEDSTSRKFDLENNRNEVKIQ